MGLLSNVILATHTGNCHCNCRRFKTITSSYFINALAVLVVLLYSVDLALAQKQNDTQTDSKPMAVQNDSKSLLVTRNGDLTLKESDRELQSPTDFFKDIKKDDNDSVGSILSPESKGLFFGEDTNGVPIVLGTWFRYGSYTLAFCMFGTAFLVACVASAIYYVLFVVTEPSQQVRSMEGEDGWNVGRILRALQLAYETYETFDLYSPSCQLKTVCEIQESGHFQGTLLKRLTHFIIHTDLVQKKMANADDLQAADRIGNDPEQTCTEKFAGCRFSLNKLYENYITM